jgi:hypothetical protein
MSHWFERPGDQWINLGVAETIEIKESILDSQTREEWEKNPFWEVVARMPSGNIDLLTMDNSKERLVEWVRDHVQ